MNADQEPLGPPTQERSDGASYHVDARQSRGLLVGNQGFQVNYFYNGTWGDGVAPPPLVSTSGAITAPYRGLAAFGERDAALFFGREDVATRVLELLPDRLASPALLVVSGVSGAGKSSLLRAGVLPRLRGAGLAKAPWAATWPCLVVTPAGKPLDELAVGVTRITGSGRDKDHRDACQRHAQGANRRSGGLRAYCPAGRASRARRARA